MKAELSWTPLGCGSYKGHNPDFPGDFLPRLKHLDLGVEEVFLAWELVRLTGLAMDPRRQRAVMLLVLAARLASAEGSTRLPLAPGGYLNRVLEEFNTTAEEQAAIEDLLAEAQQAGRGLADPGLAVLFGGPGDYRPLIIDHGCMYIQKLHVLEARVGKNLRARINGELAAAGSGPVAGKLDHAVERALQEVFNSPPVGPSGKIVLDAEQKEAVMAALTGRIAIVSGRPGSGKTSIVASVLRVLARAGRPPLESMALAAPTGKAADRMRQAITNHLAAIPDPGEADRRLAEACPPSLTLHRLLGYLPGEDRFWHNEYNPLSEQLIIVDESSMVDLAMMDQLLRALQPESRVVLIGDADQLPSIGTGAVLRDLCRSDKVSKQGRAVVLKHSYRAREEDSDGKKILDVAAAINAGISPVTAGDGKSFRAVNQASELRFQGVEHLEAANEEQVEAFWSRWRDLFRTKLPDLNKRLLYEYASGPAGFDNQTAGALQTILEHYERFRILCVTRVTAGGTGSEAVNNWFHHRWCEELKTAGKTSGNPYFLVGEPVLVTRNDYHLRLFNGDSGLLLMVKPSSETGPRAAELMAVFPRSGSFVAYPLEALRGRLELAWATTVHKAQGSEYDHVAILLPGVQVRPLTKELLYTATTRAKRSVTFTGSLEVLESGVKRKMERTSGLADML